SSAIDLVQGTLGGLAGSIPGVGIALAGIGAVAGAVYAKWEENTEKIKARVSAMYDDLLASGAEYLSQEYIQDQASAILKGDEEARIGRQQLNEAVKYTGLEAGLVALAYAGHTESMKIVEERLIAKKKEMNDETEEGFRILREEGEGAALNYANNVRKYSIEEQDIVQHRINDLQRVNDEYTEAATQVFSLRDAITTMDAAAQVANQA